MYEVPLEQHTFQLHQDMDTPYSHSYTQYSSAPNQAYIGKHGSLCLQSYANQYGPSLVPHADAISLASMKPVGAKPALQPQVSQTAPSDAESATPAKTYLLSQRNDFLLDWTMKILGVASAVLFGIWAPISYKVTADGNAGNDDAQKSLMSEISEIRRGAATLAAAQQSANSAIAKLQDQLDNIGLLRAWEFCSDKTAAVCTELVSSATIVEALSSLGGLNSQQSSRTASPTSPDGTYGAEPPTSDSAGGISVSGSALLAIILGSVFGGIIIIGLIVGILAKKRKARMIEEGLANWDKPR